MADENHSENQTGNYNMVIKKTIGNRVSSILKRKPKIKVNGLKFAGKIGRKFRQK